MKDNYEINDYILKIENCEWTADDDEKAFELLCEDKSAAKAWLIKKAEYPWLWSETYDNCLVDISWDDDEEIPAKVRYAEYYAEDKEEFGPRMSFEKYKKMLDDKEKAIELIKKHGFDEDFYEYQFKTMTLMLNKRKRIAVSFTFEDTSAYDRFEALAEEAKYLGLLEYDHLDRQTIERETKPDGVGFIFCRD